MAGKEPVFPEFIWQAHRAPKGPATSTSRAQARFTLG